MAIRVNDTNLNSVLNRKQPVKDEDLVWGAGYYTSWDGKNFQIAVQVRDSNDVPVMQQDDEGTDWYAMDIDQQASSDAMAEYVAKHPVPDDGE